MKDDLIKIKIYHVSIWHLFHQFSTTYFILPYASYTTPFILIPSVNSPSKYSPVF